MTIVTVPNPRFNIKSQSFFIYTVHLTRSLNRQTMCACVGLPIA